MVCTRPFLPFAFAVLLAFPVQAAEEPVCEAPFLEQLKRLRQHIADRELTVARAELEKAHTSLTEVKCTPALLRLNLLEGQLLLEEGRLAKADEHMRRLVLPPQTPSEVKGDFLYVVAGLAYELGQYRRARSLYEGLLELDRTLSKPDLVASDLYSIAATYIAGASGEEGREKATALLREAQAMIETTGNPANVPHVYVELGKLVGSTEGRTYLERGLDLAKAPDVVVNALGALAVDRLRDDRDEAQRLFERALAVANEALETEENLWPMLYLSVDRPTLRWATMSREEALDDIFAALRYIESVCRKQENRAARAGLFSVWTETYQWLAGRVLEDAGDLPAKEDLALAFHIMERYRARVLADSLEAAGAASTGGASTADGQDEGLFSSLDEITVSLAEDEALLTFQVAPSKDAYGRFRGGSWLLAVTRGTTHAYRLPESGPLERRVGTYLGLLAERSSAEGEAAVRLYQDLLAPALAELPTRVDKLILVPDGELHLLPFGPLRAAAEAPPLAVRYQLSTVPSATLWNRWRHAGATASTSAALVLADPLPGGVPGAPLRAALGPLPSAAEEGEEVAERMGRGSQLLLGDDATEAVLKGEDLQRFGLVHFATHAVVDAVHPERSAVLLAAGDGEDGELRAGEIAELDLADRIVVLSACRSASGSVLRGEGVMSLARAFFQAGASTVVGSLWPLDDGEAKLLFDAFYRHLGRGRSVRGALQRAQGDLRDAGAPVAAWAGVVVLGDSARVLQPTSSLNWIVAVLIALALLIVFLGHRRRKHPAMN